MNSDRGWMPDELGSLTLDQFACLMSKEMPGAPKRIDNLADYQAEVERVNAEREAEEREWKQW